jgi:hypothetical protein
MTYRIDPRGHSGVSELAVTLARAANGDTVTLLLPKDLHLTVGKKLTEMLQTQSNQMGKALAYELEEIPK